MVVRCGMWWSGAGLGRRLGGRRKMKLKVGAGSKLQPIFLLPQPPPPPRSSFRQVPRNSIPTFPPLSLYFFITFITDSCCGFPIPSLLDTLCSVFCSPLNHDSLLPVIHPVLSVSTFNFCSASPRLHWNYSKCRVANPFLRSIKHSLGCLQPIST